MWWTPEGRRQTLLLMTGEGTVKSTRYWRKEAKSAGQAKEKRRAGRMKIRSQGESLRSDEESAAVTKCRWDGDSKKLHTEGKRPLSLLSSQYTPEAELKFLGLCSSLSAIPEKQLKPWSQGMQQDTKHCPFPATQDSLSSWHEQCQQCQAVPLPVSPGAKGLGHLQASGNFCCTSKAPRHLWELGGSWTLKLQPSAFWRPYKIVWQTSCWIWMKREGSRSQHWSNHPFQRLVCPGEGQQSCWLRLRRPRAYFPSLRQTSQLSWDKPLVYPGLPGPFSPFICLTGIKYKLPGRWLPVTLDASQIANCWMGL